MMPAPSDVTHAWVNAIGTAVPERDIHQSFVDWARKRIDDPARRALFARMVARAGIRQRWSVLPDDPVADGGFYANAELPGTAARMRLYAEHAPALALRAIDQLGPLGSISHLVVASCTGFVAPGLDQIIARRLELDGSVERTLVGFMGCYAAVAALRTAHHIVRSDPRARVLVVSTELSTLHLQAVSALEPLLAMLQFGDGAAAAIVSAEPSGLRLGPFFAATLPDSADLITWVIGDTGFAMHLAGEVPGRIATALGDPAMRAAIGGDNGLSAIDGWAVHAGGRSILDAVAGALDLRADALDDSRAVLDAYGNMSSATLLFVLARILARAADHPVRDGRAIAFGPGLAAEGFRYASSTP